MTNLNEETKRKLTYDMACSMFAYIGVSRGYTRFSQCVSDAQVLDSVQGALQEINEGLCYAYEIPALDMKSYIDAIDEEIVSNAADLSIDEICSNPGEKLKKTGFLTGAAILCRNQGVYPYYIAKAVAYALSYNKPQDESSKAIQQSIQLQDIKKTVEEYCATLYEPELTQLIATQYENIGTPAAFNEEKDRLILLKKAFFSGFTYERDFSNCPQCTLAAAFDVTGQQNPALFEASSGLAGDMGLCNDGVCGGYSGALMFFSSLGGRRYQHFKDGADDDRAGKAFDISRRMHDKFIKTYGSVICSDIHQKIFGQRFQFGIEEEYNAFEKMGGHIDKCTAVVGMASLWMTELLLDDGLLT